MVKPASQVERSRRVRLAQMWLTDFGRALRSRARWNFVEMLLAIVLPRSPASGWPRAGSTPRDAPESSGTPKRRKTRFLGKRLCFELPNST